MSTPKYTTRVVPTDETWRAEIVRRVTSKKFHVSKSRENFATETEAKAWAEAEIKDFLSGLTARNQRELSKRVNKTPKT